MERRAEEQNKPLEILKHRGDLEVVQRARATGRFVLTLADYVGGLEFDGVVLVGVDEGRVPEWTERQHAQSRAYMNFAAHNRLYVAVTRVRYQIAVLGLQERGPSPIAFDVFGSLARGGNIDNPADFEFGNIWTDDHEGQLLRSILAGAENMEA
jgi:hypothetical protein